MKYLNTVHGKFICRPNRFIAIVEVGGEEQVCHVKNTGRCRELLVPGATVILEKNDGKNRKTLYDVIAVYKGDMLINMDSQAPNKVFYEWLHTTDFFGNISYIKPEKAYKCSRFDCYLEADGTKNYVEIKGVTLEESGVAMFPDAPTERGLKHVRELCEAAKNGYGAYVFFIIQMQGCKYFTPNERTHKELADALRKARNEGVGIYALCCHVSEDSMSIDNFTEVKL